MLVFAAIGLLLWIAFLFAVLILCGTVWAFCKLVLGTLYVISPPKQNKVASVRPVPQPSQAPAMATSDIWPKWTPAHRRYVDEELALWQEQFDALSSRK